MLNQDTESWCPISLVPVQDLIDPVVLPNVPWSSSAVYSKQELFRWIVINAKPRHGRFVFKHPITQNVIDLGPVKPIKKPKRYFDALSSAVTAMCFSQFFYALFWNKSPMTIRQFLIMALILASFICLFDAMVYRLMRQDFFQSSEEQVRYLADSFLKSLSHLGVNQSNSDVKERNQGVEGEVNKARQRI